MKIIRHRYTVLIALILLLSAGMIRSVVASPDLRHFSLSSFDVDVEYPSTVKPGDTVTVTATATSKSSAYVLDLTIEVLVPSTSGEMRSIYSMLWSRIRVLRLEVGIPSLRWSLFPVMC